MRVDTKVKHYRISKKVLEKTLFSVLELYRDMSKARDQDPQLRDAFLFDAIYKH